jgi:NADH-quinone oxidoreductase subunit A
MFLIVAVGFVTVTLLAYGALRKGGWLFASDPSRTSREPYECGNEPESFALEHRFSIRYYLIAVLFVIFDVETIFLYPWAVMYDQLGLFGLIEMTIFLFILVLGYIYVWRRGALKWA